MQFNGSWGDTHHHTMGTLKIKSATTGSWVRNEKGTRRYMVFCINTYRIPLYGLVHNISLWTRFSYTILWDINLFILTTTNSSYFHDIFHKCTYGSCTG